MRISFAITAFILVLGAAYGWHSYEKLVRVRQVHAGLVLEAGQLGISIDGRGSSDVVRVTKREREINTETDAKQLAADFISFAREMEAANEDGGGGDSNKQKRVIELIDRMISLNAAQIKILITELRGATGIRDEMREGMIGFSIMTLAGDHPELALAILTESSDLLKEKGMGEHVVSSSLSGWAKRDPIAAMEWVKANREKNPNLVSEDAKCGLISGTAANDPKLAFKFISELQLNDPSNAVKGIVSAANTPAERTATLEAMREYLSTVTDEASRGGMSSSAFSQMAQASAKEGFDAATRWAESSLTPAEFGQFADGVSHLGDNREEGKWIEWIGNKLPAEKSSELVTRMVRSWTQEDYQAAGTWLNSAPAGPTKNTAIRTYAEAVSRYEPEAAAQWAVSLPPGKERNETLKGIYQNWPRKDQDAKDAAEAFAKLHGIDR
jgi:hypothetical protein